MKVNEICDQVLEFARAVYTELGGGLSDKMELVYSAPVEETEEE